MDRKLMIQVDWFGDHVIMREGGDESCKKGYHTITFRNTRQEAEIEMKISCLSRHSMFGTSCPWYDNYAQSLQGAKPPRRVGQRPAPPGAWLPN